jgi:hypothetical protein
MGTFERRARRLEQMFAEQASPEARRGPDHDWVAIMDELSALKSSQAVHYRGGVRIEPQNLPQKYLGDNYTREELRELAIARGLEKRGYDTHEIAELLPVWLEHFEDGDRRRMEAQGKPSGGVRSR